MKSFTMFIYRIFGGRINRKQFVLGTLFLGYIFGSLSFIYVFGVVGLPLPSNMQEMYTLTDQVRGMWTLFPLYILQGLFSTSLLIRRLKDCDINPLYFLASIFLPLHVVLVVFLSIRKGDDSSNQYGATPMEKRNIFDVIMNQ